MLLRTFVSAVLVFTSLAWVSSAQAAVVPVVGAMQGTTIFATQNGSLEQSLQPAAATALQIHPVLGAPTKPIVNSNTSDANSNIYAMLALGALGLTVIRRKRYGRK
jgi:hypothetical protein